MKSFEISLNSAYFEPISSPKLECEILKFKLFLRNNSEHDGSKTGSIGSIIVERVDVGTRGGTIERKSSV